jgi:hypothetical protein
MRTGTSLCSMLGGSMPVLVGRAKRRTMPTMPHGNPPLNGIEAKALAWNSDAAALDFGPEILATSGAAGHPSGGYCRNWGSPHWIRKILTRGINQHAADGMY